MHKTIIILVIILILIFGIIKFIDSMSQPVSLISNSEYEDLWVNPDNHIDDLVKLKGKVLEISEGAEETYVLLRTNENKNGTLVYNNEDFPDIKLIPSDEIQVYAWFLGLSDTDYFVFKAQQDFKIK